MEQVSEQLHALNYSRTGSSEVRVRVHGVNRCARHSPQQPRELD
jgi:hypothetical protein